MRRRVQPARQKFPLASRAHICTVSAQPGGEKGKGEAALLLSEGGAFVLCPDEATAIRADAQRGFLWPKSCRNEASKLIARGRRARKTAHLNNFSAKSTDGPWRKSKISAKIGCFSHFYDIFWAIFGPCDLSWPPQTSQIT